jgi:hypothetical protein
MGVRGPQPGTNSRRRGARIAISPEHTAMLDRLKVGSQSRADVAEMAIEYWAEFLDGIPKPPAENPDA